MAETLESSSDTISRSCNLDDERLDSSNGRWVRQSFPSDEVCLELTRDAIREPAFRGYRSVYHGDRPPHCWLRDDLTKMNNECAEPGCQFVITHRWLTDLKREPRWFGRWEQYDCSYDDFDDRSLQQCIDKKSISSIQTKGSSISSIVKVYLNQKLRNIKMVKSGTRTVIFDTLKMPHLLWHNSIDVQRKQFEEFPNVTDSNIEHFWLSGFYFTSEREPHVNVDRSLLYSKMAMDILTPKGYKMINGFDVSAAFAYDTDAQADGLHITGPPMKEIVTKFLHHLCKT